MGNPTIPFHIPYLSGAEKEFVEDAISRKDLSGEGHYTRACQVQLQQFTGSQRVLLTPSCTHALELSALLLDLQPGDEIIMPSFTFVSTANAFLLRGAVPVFVDIRPDTMNLDENLIETAITAKTKAIVVMHYAGVACEMDTIMELAKKYQLAVVEDAAQCAGAYYKGRHLGTIGDFGTLSFHSTKNIHCGEGGALLINEEKYINRAEIIREKGTNRNQFLKGQVDKYSWVDVGSSILMGELNAAFLSAQLPKINEVARKRNLLWQEYEKILKPLKALFDFPEVPEFCRHNSHIFYIKCKDEQQRNQLIDHLKKRNISTAFHYVPLHSSKAGRRFGRFSGEDRFTTRESERLLRLPLFYDWTPEMKDYIVQEIIRFSTIDKSYA